VQIAAKRIAFMSHKGGVGRSLALANVAHALARKGLCVGCVDLDFNAPGLGVIMGLSETPPDTLTTASILATSRVLDVDSAVLDIASPGPGSMSLLPSANLPEVVGTIKWDHKGLLVDCLRKVCDRFAEKCRLDVVMLDAQAGLSAASALAREVCDLAVCVFRIDRQGQQGVRWAQKVLLSHGRAALYVPSLVPPGKAAQAVLEGLSKDIRLEDCIPYSASMALEEKVVTAGNRKTRVAEGYRSLAERVIDAAAISVTDGKG
jgi:MinD-like ATPase involved in chromosome partitioning or flagellar assembly